MPDEIQETFDLESALGFLLYKAHQRAAAEFRRLLEPLALTPQQFAVLALLHLQDGSSQAGLCERGATDANTMVGIIDRLEAAGLIGRQRDPRDRRAHVIRVLPAGRRVFERCLPIQRVANERVFGHLSAAEQDRLRQLLKKIFAHDPGPRGKEATNGR